MQLRAAEKEAKRKEARVLRAAKATGVPYTSEMEGAVRAHEHP